MRLDSKALATAGELLFGSQWQSDLARMLGVSSRLVREWKSDRAEIPNWVWPAVRQANDERARALVEFARQLPKPKDERATPPA